MEGLRSMNNKTLLILFGESPILAANEFDHNPFSEISTSKLMCKCRLKVKRIIREPIPFRDEKLHDVIFHRKGR